MTLEDEDLAARAARLYPDSEYLQAEWMRAVRQLRAGRGWVLDSGTPAPGWHAAPYSFTGGFSRSLSAS